MVDNYPIIIVSAKVQGHEKIVGLHTGADDYITKPFDPLELLARVNAQLRRYYKFNDNKEESENNKLIKIGDLALNKEDFTLKKNGETINLTSTEYRILELFMNNTNKVFTKKNIFESVWKEPYFHEDNAIMVHISKLRDKIKEDSKNPKYIKTVRGLGYKFKDDKDDVIKNGGWIEILENGKIKNIIGHKEDSITDYNRLENLINDLELKNKYDIKVYREKVDKDKIYIIKIPNKDYLYEKNRAG